MMDSNSFTLDPYSIAFHAVRLYVQWKILSLCYNYFSRYTTTATTNNNTTAIQSRNNRTPQDKKRLSNIMDDRILSAAQKNNAEEIERLVKSGVSPSHSNSLGQSALHIAALWGNVEAVETLLRLKASANAKNWMGCTPLFSAVQSTKEPALNRVACAKLLIQTGNADVAPVDLYEKTPLQYLESNNEAHLGRGQSEEDAKYYEEMKNVLMDGMENVASSTDNERQLAIKKMHRFVDELNESGLKTYFDEDTKEFVSVLETRRGGMTPLLAAVNQIQTQCQSLAEDEEKDAKMQKACNIMKFLILHGANLTPNDEDGGEVNKEDVPGPLQTPSKKQEYSLLFTMIEEITSLPPKTSKQIRSCLLSVIKELQEQKTDDEEPSEQEQTKTINLFHDCARKGSVPNVQFFLDNLEMDVNAVGRQGLTALHFAARSGKAELIQWLLENTQVDLDIKDNRGKTALHYGMVNNKVEIIKLLKKDDGDGDGKKES